MVLANPFVGTLMADDTADRQSCPRSSRMWPGQTLHARRFKCSNTPDNVSPPL